MDPRASRAYRAAAAVVRRRVELDGEVCCFYRKRGFELCPGFIDLRLPYNHRWAFTAHHVHRLMHGGDVLADPSRMRAAHRSCNAADGLRAQNARRAALSVRSSGERTSERW